MKARSSPSFHQASLRVSPFRAITENDRSVTRLPDIPASCFPGFLISGRFQINPLSGDQYILNAFPPEGEPYLIAHDELNWSKGVVAVNHDFKLARGVVIRGKVIDGRPRARLERAVHPDGPAPQCALGMAGDRGQCR